MGIQLGQGAIVPKNAISPAGHQHRYSADGVELTEMGKAAPVICGAICLLAQSAQHLPFRGEKPLLHPLLRIRAKICPQLPQQLAAFPVLKDETGFTS